MLLSLPALLQTRYCIFVFQGYLSLKVSAVKRNCIAVSSESKLPLGQRLMRLWR